MTPRVDTVELAQVFYPTLEKYNLSHLSKELGLQLQEAHTAIADAQATARLFLKLLEKIESLPKETLESISRYSESLLFETGMVITKAIDDSQPFNPKQYYKIQSILLKKPPQKTKSLKLSQSFDLNIALLGLEERQEQSHFAHCVQQAYHDQRPSFIEAQAGIGKTYGYLLPLLAQKDPYQIILSVPTKILQDQVMAGEIAAIRQAFQINCHSIKGPANYIKLDAFSESLGYYDDNRLVNRYKMQLLVWLLETSTGDLAEIKQKQRFAAYFDQIKHDGQLNKSSPFYDNDFWQLSYEKAKEARLLVTNHAYFLHRVQDDKDFAKNKVLVFDEAQKIMLELDSLSRNRLNLSLLLKELHEEIPHRQSLLEKRLLESIAFELGQAASDFYQAKENQHLLSWEKLKQQVSELDTSDFMTLQTIFSGRNTDFWISSEKKDDKRLTYLNASSQDFLHFKKFLPETIKTYFISATLHISPQVSLANLLGYDDYHFDSIPKKKTHQQQLFIDQEMPLIKAISDQDYAQVIAERLYALNRSDFPILVLFNAKKHLLMVSDLLDNWRVGHLAQEKNGSPFNIKKRFDRGEESILLGLGSFWEGVDFVQADRMIEVITRLPFDNPEDLFVQKMSRYLQENGKNPFNDYFLPMAILKLKQAIGRTMRRPNQKSAVLILDRRVSNEGYGQIILSSLADEFPISQEKFQDCLVEMTDFLL